MQKLKKKTADPILKDFKFEKDGNRVALGFETSVDSLEFVLRLPKDF